MAQMKGSGRRSGLVLLILFFRKELFLSRCYLIIPVYLY